MTGNVKDKIRDNPKDWICCHCKAPMQKRMATSGSADLRPGLLVICGQCGRVNVLGDSSLHPLTKSEFMALDEPTRRSLLITAQGIKQLVESGGSWNPYQNQ